MTTVFNLIIVDESGSMDCIRRETVNNFIETINTVRSAQQQFASTQRHLLSIYLFQDNPSHPSHYLVRNKPIDDVATPTADDYSPWGGTPLYDAVGSTLTDLEAVASTHDDAIGSITIITDGYENASRRYSGRDVAAVISRLKEKGWNVNIIGANIDVRAMASDLNIDNSLSFEQTAKGTACMTERFTDSYARFCNDLNDDELAHPNESRTCEEKAESRRMFSKKFFSR